MRRYVRFETALRCADTGRRLGIFRSAGRVEDWCSPEIRNQIGEVCQWFNDNLTRPASDAVHWRAQFWFRDDARSVIARIWKLLDLLKGEGVRTELVHSLRPGRIVYQDRHQIAAVPKRWRKRKLKPR